MITSGANLLSVHFYVNQTIFTLKKNIFNILSLTSFGIILLSASVQANDDYYLEINRGLGQHHAEQGDTYGVEIEKHLADSHLVFGFFYDYEIFHGKGGDHYQQLMGTQMAYVTDEHLKFSFGLGAAQGDHNKTYLLARASVGYQYLLDKKRDMFLCPSLAVDYFNQEAETATMLGLLFHL